MHTADRYLLHKEKKKQELFPEYDLHDQLNILIFLHLDPATLLTTRLVCKRWDTYLPIITPLFCEQKGFPITSSFFFYCLMLQETGPYAHFFPPPTLDLKSNGTFRVRQLARKCQAIPDEEFEHNDFIQSLITVNQDSGFFLGASLGEARLFYLQKATPIRKETILNKVCINGNLQALYSCDVTYPNFCYKKEVPEDWIAEQLKENAKTTRLLSAALNSDNLLLAEKVLTCHPGSLNENFLGNCSAQKTFNWLLAHGSFHSSAVLAQAFKIVDLSLDFLQNLPGVLDYIDEKEECFYSLLANKNYACLQWVCSKKLDLTCDASLSVGAAKLFAYFRPAYHPVSAHWLKMSIEEGNLKILTWLLECYPEEINWPVLMADVQEMRKVAPKALLLILATDAKRDGLDLFQRWSLQL